MRVIKLPHLGQMRYFAPHPVHIFKVPSSTNLKVRFIHSSLTIRKSFFPQTIHSFLTTIDLINAIILFIGFVLIKTSELRKFFYRIGFYDVVQNHPIIKKEEWDNFYYYERQIEGQIQITDESFSDELDKVRYCLNSLKSQGYIDHTNYSVDKFKEFRLLVHEKFVVYWTAINPPMEHLLWALSEITQPKRIMGLGIFTGNPVVWSMGPALMNLYSCDVLEAVEIDKDHARVCQNNFDAISFPGKVAVYAEDGFDVISRVADQSVDLLYLDANGKDPLGKTWSKRRSNTKRINYSFLFKMLPKIKPSGFAMCHNVYQPSFREHAGDFLELTADVEHFSKTVTLAIDEMGLEFSIKKD